LGVEKISGVLMGSLVEEICFQIRNTSWIQEELRRILEIEEWKSRVV
jgi:hypothetical protein